MTVVSLLIILYSIHRKVFPVCSFQRLLDVPAAGYRNAETGALTNVGTNGYSLSSSPLSSGSANMGYLNFNSGNVNPVNSWYRSAGFTVRCVQASAWKRPFVEAESEKKIAAATFRPWRRRGPEWCR